MKKILLATTMLAAATGYASADVKVSGSAWMGIADLGNINAAAPLGNGKAEGAQFNSRVRIQFDGSGTTDGGLSFGATTRADQSAGNSTDTHTTNQSSTVWVSGAFGKVTFGDVAGGATDELVGQVSEVGFTSLNSWNQVGGLSSVTGSWLSAGSGTAVRYDYTSGNLSVALGLGQVGSTESDAGTNKASVAVKYVMGNYSAAIGYESLQAGTATAANDQIGFKGTATFGAATVALKVVQPKWANAAGTTSGKTEFAVSLDYAVSSALKLTAFYADHKNVATDPKSTGLGATYDLGGGAKIQGGVARSGLSGAKTAFDLGITMAF